MCGRSIEGDQSPATTPLGVPFLIIIIATSCLISGCTGTRGNPGSPEFGLAHSALSSNIVPEIEHLILLRGFSRGLNGEVFGLPTRSHPM